MADGMNSSSGASHAGAARVFLCPATRYEGTATMMLEAASCLLDAADAGRASALVQPDKLVLLSHASSLQGSDQRSANIVSFRKAY